MHASESSIVLKNMSDCARTGLIGGTSSLLATFLYMPFHYAQSLKAQGLEIKIKMNNIHHCFRGYTILAANNIPVIALQTAVYKLINNIMGCSHNNKDPNEKTTLAAILAGTSSAPFSNASGLLAVHKQNTGLPIRTIINNFPHRYKSLSRGIVPSTLQGILFATTYTNGLPFIKNYIHHYCDNTLAAFTSSACLSSILLTATTQPLRVMATKLHADVEEKYYKGASDVFIKTIHQHGLKNFYTGSSFRTCGNILALSALYIIQQMPNYLKM